MATIREEETANSKEEEKEPEQHIGWAGVHYMFAQNKTRQNLEQDLKKLILLDSDSNTTIFCERKYVTEVWNVEETMGVGTNGNGQLVSNQKCMVPNLGEH